MKPFSQTVFSYPYVPKTTSTVLLPSCAELISYVHILQIHRFSDVPSMFPTIAMFGIFILQTLFYFLPLCHISHF
jgi:hypothetical protein